MLVVAAVILAALRARADASLLVAIVASQLLSPVLWDHYAMLLLLPVAWLLERRQWWAVLIPLVTSAVTARRVPAGPHLPGDVLDLAPRRAGRRAARGSADRDREATSTGTSSTDGLRSGAEPTGVAEARG